MNCSRFIFLYAFVSVMMFVYGEQPLINIKSKSVHVCYNGTSVGGVDSFITLKLTGEKVYLSISYGGLENKYFLVSKDQPVFIENSLGEVGKLPKGNSLRPILESLCLVSLSKPSKSFDKIITLSKGDSKVYTYMKGSKAYSKAVFDKFGKIRSYHLIDDGLVISFESVVEGVPFRIKIHKGNELLYIMNRCYLSYKPLQLKEFFSKE